MRYQLRQRRQIHASIAAAWLLGLVGCAQIVPLTVERIDASVIAPDENNIVLVNRTRWDVDLRRALRRAGFNVKRFASTTVKQIHDDNISRKFNEAEARYGITQYPGGVVDSCIGTKSVMYDEFTLEVADLVTNDVVMTITQGGWTGHCGIFDGGELFVDLANALRKNWN